MSIDTVYIEAAIETLDLINQLTAFLSSKQQSGEITDYLSQILTKADARISSSLGQSLGINIPVDQGGKPTKYWEGVRDTAKLSTQKWTALGDIPRFSAFLSATKSNLSARLGITASEENPLEAFVGETPAEPVAEPNPLEDILSSTAPETPPQPTTPAPKPITPTPAVSPTPAPKPITPTPAVSPTPTPEPITPKMPEPEPDAMIPTPKPVTPTPEPLVPEPSDKLTALDEALKTSGLEQPAAPQPSPSLSDMLLSKEESGDKPEEEDDMLSLSLREALKILRDEDED